MLRRASVVLLFVVLMPATVQAFDHHHHHSSGHSSGGDGCGGSSSDHASSSAPASAPPPSTSPSAPSPSSSTHKRVFITSTTYSGALGGLDAADSFCQSSATEHGLAGTYRAWLSDSGADAYDRVSEVGPWYTTTDALAFADKSDLRASPRTQLLDETGGYPQALTGAWSGSDSTGVATAQDCEGWTNATAAVSATTGSTFGSDAAWGGGDAPLPCNAKAPLICFQQ